MICKVVAIFSVISISAYGSESHQKSHSAISTQSFYRNDVPLYKFNAIHDYKTPNKPQKIHNAYGQQKLRPVRIQYAPLPYKFKLKDYEVQRDEDKQIEHQPVHLIENGQHIYSTEGTLQKSHLEPRLVTQFDKHKQGQKTFIPGHNVEVLQPPTNRYLGRVDPFVTHQEIQAQKHQVTTPKLNNHQKVQSHNDTPTSTLRNEVKSRAMNNLNFLGFLLNESNKSFLPKESRAAQANVYSLHNELAMEKPSQSYQHGPRLHLNIARFYSIADQPQKALISTDKHPPLETPQQLFSHAHIKQITNVPQKTPEPRKKIMKPPLQPQTFFIPKIIDSHNTILYPVRSYTGKLLRL